jgi:hypothetical protein
MNNNRLPEIDLAQHHKEQLVVRIAEQAANLRHAREKGEGIRASEELLQLLIGNLEQVESFIARIRSKDMQPREGA